MKALLKLHPADSVVVALRALQAGETADVSGQTVTLMEDVPQGHKVALAELKANQPVVKYGCVIGTMTKGCPAGGWVHTHNLRTNLTEQEEEVAFCAPKPLAPEEAPTFLGYRTEDGRAAVRNEIWILPLVGCVNDICRALERAAQPLVSGTLEGIYAFSHPYGCSQTGADHAQTRKLLASLAHHPNAAEVLIVALGCENLTVEQFWQEYGEDPEGRVHVLVCQQEEDELTAGLSLLEEAAARAKCRRREPIPMSELVVGLKCGGSDGLSGVTANPVVGRFSDHLVAMGGSTILTEVPEMFGAERLLFSRAETPAVLSQAQAMVSRFKDYFVRHGEAVYENPSPGNKAGGITTLEDKSCGCVQKGGSAPVSAVLDYSDRVSRHGLQLLYGPGNDLVSATAMTAAGAHLILFTTGRGTPFGAPVPTLKLSTNTPLFEKKSRWMDYNAGTVADGTETIDEAATRLLLLVQETASGKCTRTERMNCRELAIFKDGITL